MLIRRASTLLLLAMGAALPPTMPVNHKPFGALEHVNLNTAWTRSTERFWFDIMRCSSDDRALDVLNATNEARRQRGDPLMGGLDWLNVGLQQFHLPTDDALERRPQQLRGEIVLSWPRDKISGLRDRLEDANYIVDADIRFVGPHGNRFKVEPGDTFFGPANDLGSDARDALPGGPSEGLGIRAVRLDVPRNTTTRICEFYSVVFDADAQSTGTTCVVLVGFHQSLEFVETDVVPEYQGEHVALYVAEGYAFREAYFRVHDKAIVFHNPRSPQVLYDTYDNVLRFDEFRFKDIVDIHTGDLLYELEHEIRSLDHSGFLLKHRIPDDDPARAAAAAAADGDRTSESDSSSLGQSSPPPATSLLRHHLCTEDSSARQPILF